MKIFLMRYKQWFIGGIIGLVIVWNMFGDMGTSNFETLSIASLEEELKTESLETVERVALETTPALIMVEVKGAVENPGVYELAQDARVKNVLDMASLLPEANLMHVNQSLKLSDEMVIYVPTEAEVAELSSPVITDRNSSVPEQDDGIININTAGKAELMTLNGIGEKTAQAIVEHREMNGLFMHKEDIKQVSGIGDKKFIAIEPNIVVD